MPKSFKIRTSKPSTWMAVYNNYNNGGWSWCINGCPTDPVSNVLANCVGYACGRFHEIYNELTGEKGMKFPQLCCNAEDFWTVAESLGLKRGFTPKPGAIMVWEGYGDAAGHVAIVERVDSEIQVYTSESGWESPAFWNGVRYKGDGNWGAGGGYRFLGFIYNPAVKDRLDITGEWDSRTTKFAQKAYGLNKTGVILHQYRSTRKHCPACKPVQKDGGSWTFDSTKGSSALIVAIQKDCGLQFKKKSKRYGRFTKITRKALQKKLGVVVDGTFGPESVKAFQKYINKKLK